jgi:hypothetical protein
LHACPFEILNKFDPSHIAGNKKKVKNAQHAMDADDDAGWMTGPIGEAAGEEMDTREAADIADGVDAAASAPAPRPRVIGFREKPGPRGKRTSAQKKRKADKLKKALAVADRTDTKVGNRNSLSATKKSVKSLWQSGGKRR